ncbi:hypothetical protein FOVG_18936, partial [Fusarium oxysporum f. sp. pisi HDV247]|uniref:Uncharacterized protein n=3 Tax=Fusarium oxysporum TaxID=5507 RepID=X0LNR3_FUSOX
MAHPIGPVTRQRDDKAELAYRSRFWPDIRRVEISLCVCGSSRLPQGGPGQMEGVVAPFVWP